MSKLNLTDTSAAAEYATVYVAFELSKAKWKVGVMLPGSQRVSRFTIDGGRGLGVVSAQKLMHEVFYRSFDNRRQVGSYFGLTNCAYDSGDSHRDQGISKAGNRRGRALAVELAWLWLRFQPGSELSRWFNERVGTIKGRIRRITIVALARKLMIALWRYVTTGVVPAGAVLRPSI